MSAIITVDSAVVVNNYVSDDSFMDVGTGPISVKQVGCVKASSGPGNMNHFELRVSQHEIDVYGTDAGNTTGPMTELAVISNMSLTLTRGLMWMEDVHYNGDKDGPDQGTHTFTWDNVGFDGPTLPRDLAFDAPDNLAAGPRLSRPAQPGLDDRTDRSGAVERHRARRIQHRQRVARPSDVQLLHLQPGQR